jgi:thymidine phosphorylase
MIQDTSFQYKSEFLPNVTVVVVFEEDSNYSELKKFFDVYGYGFMVPNKDLIIIDGEQLLSNDNDGALKFIEAHEVSHILLNHDGPRNNEEEIEADLGAYIILKKNEYTNSLKILLNTFENRHGIPFEENLLDKVSKKFDF